MPQETRAKLKYELQLPAMGEGIIEATITKWLVSPGQHVKIDQSLVEVATDKVDSEIPSPVEGTIVSLIYREGEIPGVGSVIALIETEDNDAEKRSVQPVDSSASAHQVRERLKPSKPVADISRSNLRISPLVRMVAKQLGIGAEELKRINGTGENGEIMRKDIDDYLMEGRTDSVPFDSLPFDSAQGDRGNAQGDRGNAQGEKVDRGNERRGRVNGNGSEVHLNTGDKLVEMDRMRKLIASHMLSSKKTAAHVTSFLEADVTMMVKWREEHKDQFLRREKVKLTFTPVFIEAVALTLRDFPRINVSVSGEYIVYRSGIHVGIATALNDGNLIVPVIKNADHENLAGLSRKLNDLADRARKGALHPEEIKGGTFTITNIGQYNNLTGTPIINQPESAILAFGTILKKPWAVKTPDGYGVAVRDVMMLALTYDHRVIDGALGGSFLSKVAHRLENFDTSREL